MPFVYGVVPGATLTTGTANTATDHLFIKPGTRNVGLQAIYVVGRGAGLTAISGMSYRLEKWTTAASTSGTAITPSPRDPGMQASKCTAAYNAITSGTGGPTLMLSIGSGAAGPGGWVAPNPDSVHVLEGGAAMSLDIFDVSGTASMIYEISIEVVE